jgi:hypothetical protein
MNAWLNLCPQELLNDASVIVNDGMVSVPQTLRNDLAALFIHLYERS